MSDLIDGVGSIDTIDGFEGTGLLVRLTEEINPDDLLLYVAKLHGSEYGEWRADDPTTLPPYPFLDRGREAQIGWFRKQPCSCGEEHSWDMAFVSDEKPEGNKRYGAFLGVFFG